MIRHFLFFLVAFVQAGLLQAQVPTPKEHFGFNIGDDYHLANYTQTEAYFKKLAAASDRVQLEDMGPTEEGRHQYMLIVSSPENIKNLQKYKSISQRLARAEGLTDAEARQVLRFTMGRTTVDDDVDAVLAALPDAVERARAASGSRSGSRS